METNVDTHRPPRRRVRRAGQSVLVAGLTLLAVASASPAGAAEPTPGLRWRYDRGEELQDARLSGKVRLRAEVSTEAPVDGWSITVVTPTGEPVFGTVCDERFKRPRSEFWVDCRWDTGRYADQGPSANGRYLIRVTARQDDGLQPVGPDRAVAVTNAASAPQDVTMSYDEVGERATLTWLPNPEPDVARYDVEEEIKGNWTRVAETTEPRFETRLTDAAHRFRVAAERRNADGAADGPGPWSVAAQPRQSGRPSRKEATRRERSDSRSESARTPSPERREATATTGTAPATTPANTEQPAARTAASGAPRTPNPPPAESAGLAFSPSSAGAFSALADTHVSAPVGRKATAGPSTRPATAPPASPTALGLGEPDTGFQETLPYPQPEEEALAAPPEPAPVADPPPTAPATRRSGAVRRLVGVALVVAGVALLGVALRPKRRRRRGVPLRPVVETGRTPAPYLSDEEPAWLARLEDCVTRLEACVDQRRVA